MTPEAFYANALNQITELGPARLCKLREYAGNFEYAWKLSTNDLTEILQDPALAETISTARVAVDPGAAWQALEKAGIYTYTRSDPAYPSDLHNIPTPPEVLYARGGLPKKDTLAIAIVGTRKPTAYGLEACATLAEDLARAGCTIISGLARGIDTKAHEACLKANGTTIAVLGSGMHDSVLYPAVNRQLATRIMTQNGTLISEYPLTMHAQPWTFPQRNRIVAGLADGILVIEAQEKSGALITARFGLETGKDIFAVPGQIFSLASVGPHALIKEGAALVATARDILDTYGITYQGIETPTYENLPEGAADILTALTEPKHRDQIARETGKSAEDTNRLISLLEVHAMIKHVGQGVYRKV
ncbi:MAG: DNA protecting protein DprA [Candidatus Ryanbacteria bacterium RIFCSPHIGHO2_02_FULL_48_12]|uniref:DNA protecting protein DprA n=1 Tax=Candidatus Ryanbacteria bacterium RIFCSPHIGHO2_01_FULL_48_27 TaxID=1802115 RepID=A0A1G2G3W9_9BACT|nr:MAG: DNA protecting protein DprA [Candidatus Ryanbacteria bacterium RIFCSPHIGHO2_01_FULL_48_27]OGZ50717.1 MAG: DNA protecting protein DprA [Candidatus Ryanbacteria bacterium RIFCSPHIGHO2_02_FULL_48_12]